MAFWIFVHILTGEQYDPFKMLAIIVRMSVLVEIKVGTVTKLYLRLRAAKYKYDIRNKINALF